ncbi:class I adenylate-forming enzyme family protein [Sneathiella sp. HT1-7]|uniref:class I adenylate-forming enzyme family protein n=1 Tax=Sneathiella sp. HT1-7 TaxID=2887192 RepID=UPI001D15565D|nr:AMP-binding protein [Sneathiella sp. HT1-7]MCC3305183.1 AMP-binding protein [Sneathiella sp. HT1-7]
MRVIDYFDRGVALDPERICLKDNSISRSYAEVQERNYRIANALIRLGVKPQVKGAVFSSNAVPAFECCLGMLRAGIVWVPLNAKNEVKENAYILDNCDVEILFYHSEFEEKAGKFAKLCPKIQHLICIDKSGGRGVYLEDWIEGEESNDPDIPSDQDTLASIFSSGGTTGLPKGVLWTNRIWDAMITAFYTTMPMKKPPVHLVVAPMSHAAGVLAILSMANGGTQVILPQFDAEMVAKTIESEGVTHLFLPPTAIYMLLAYPDVKKFDYSSLEHFIYAAAPMSVDKLKECLDIFGPVMSQSFGQAEAPMFCTYLSPQDHLVIGSNTKEKRLASCGRQTLQTRVRIMDDEGNILPPNERGEIVVQGNLVMTGYYKNPEATEEVSTFGWHHTGDIGYIDEDGYVYIVDRKKDMIITGGFNVYPSEIEQVIWGHPSVQDCAVIGAPDEKWGEAVKAVIELKAGCTLEEEEIISLCKKTLGSVKAPKSVEIWKSLPRTPVGKVRKKDIRASFWTNKERAI